MDRPSGGREGKSRFKMFDLGWSKLIIIAIVAIVVVGPKDLPPLLRAIGKFLSQMRRQAEEFRAQFNEAMKDTGLDEIRRDVEGIRSTAQSAAYDISRSMEESTRPVGDAVADINRGFDAQTSAAAVPAAIASDGNGGASDSHGVNGLNGYAHPGASSELVPASEITLPTSPPAGLMPSSPAAAAAAAAAAADPVKGT